MILWQMGANNEAFSVGDFVYLAPDSADGKQPMIVCVQEIVKGEGGALQVRGCYMLRPQATAHQAGRRLVCPDCLLDCLVRRPDCPL